MNWFKYISGDPYNPSNYNLDNNPGCIGSDTLCAINASSDVNGKPVITGTIQTAIDNALNGIVTSGVTQLRAS